MPICHHVAPNGEKSILYQHVEEKYGEQIAHDVWTAVRTQQFFNKAGNWIKGNVPAHALDRNGEPKLEWILQKDPGLFKATEKPQVSSFKPANQEQIDTIKGIQDFITRGNPDTYFTVAGKAGTGKTTIVQEAIVPFIEQKKSVLIAALSHKAKLVLANKLQDRFGADAVNSKSIAGALAMAFDMETGDFTADYDQQYVVPPVAKADIIIIDEASMVNEEALSLIMEKKRPNAKVIFLGDIGQLPPIRKKGDPNEGKPAPVFSTTDNTAKLITRVRQGEESPILPYADLFWDNSQSKSPKENPAKDLNRKDIVNDKGALVFASNVNSVLPKVLPLYKEAIETNQPNLVKIVLYRNAPRIAINNAVREYIFGNDAKTRFLPKELLIFTDNYTPDFMDEPISNSTELQVSSAEPGMDAKTGLKTWEIGFAYEGSPVQVTVLDPSEKSKHDTIISALFAEAKTMAKGSNRNAKLKEAWSEKKRFAPLDYAYAITSHKSQGSTYNTVVVDENDIMNVGPIGPKEKSQSIYTALTRASTTTIVVDGQKTNQENLDNAIALSHSKMAAPVVVPEPATTPQQVIQNNSTKEQQITAGFPDEFERTIKGFKVGQRYSTKRDGSLDRTFQTISHNGYTIQREVNSEGKIRFSRSAVGDRIDDTTPELKEEFYRLMDKEKTSDEEYIKIVLGENYQELLPYISGVALLENTEVPSQPVEGTKTTPTQAEINAALAKPSIPQKYKDGGVSVQGIQMQTRIPGRTSGDMIRNGERTETTRSGNQFSKPKIGDLEIHEDSKGKMLVRVTTEAYKPNKLDFDKYEGWADEQWERSQHHFTDKWFSYRFEYLGDVIGGKLNTIPKTVSNALPVPGPASTPVQKLDTSKMKVVPVTLEPSGDKTRSNDTRDSEEVMMANITKIYNDAIANPNNLYKVDYKFTSPKYKFKSGYTALELANMFDQYGIPANVEFNPSFYKVIQNSSKRIQTEFAPQQPTFINRDEVAINADMGRILIPKINDQGQVQGFFTPAEHKDIVDSIVYGISTLWSKDQAKGSKALILFFDGLNNSRNRMLQSGTNLDLAPILGFIHNSRVRLAEEAIRQLGNYGWKIGDKDQAKVLKSLENFAELGELDKQVTLSDGTIANVQATLDDNGDIIEQSGHGLQDYGDSTFELDPKDTASGRMKMFIATLPEVDRQLQAIKNFFGMKKLVDFEQTFEDSLNILADHPTGKFMDMVKDFQESGKPNLINLANELMKQDKQMQNEFKKVMSKQYQQFTMMLFNHVKDKSGSDTFTLQPINANRYSQQKTIINNWKEQQKLSEIMITNTAGQRVMDVQRVQEKWVPWLEVARATKDWTNATTLSNTKKYVKNILDVSGIEMSDQMIDYLFRNMEKLTKGTSVAGGIRKQFEINEKGEPEGIFSAFILKSAGKTSIHDVVPENDAVTLAEQNNPLFTETTSMQILAKVAAMFTPKLYSASHKSSEGKNVWDYGQNTKLSLKLRSMLNDFTGFRDLMLETDIAKDNWYLNHLQNNQKLLANISLGYLDGTKPTWGKRGTTRQDMSDREQAFLSMGLFQNQGYSNAHFISLTHSDKTTTPVFKNIPRLKMSHPRHLGFDPAGNPLSNKAIGQIDSPLYNVFKSEWNRVTNPTKDYNNNQYNAGKNLFYFIPEFNYDAMKKMVSDRILDQKEMNLLWVNGERDFTQSINNDKELKVINKILTLVTQRRVQGTIENWKKMGIIKEDGTMMFDKKYVKQLKSQFDINRSEDVIQAAAQDYSINTFMFNTAMSQLFYGDPAIAWKGKPGQSDMQQVAATMKEYAKRLAKDIAPGQDPAWEDNATYNTITLFDVKPDEQYLRNVSEKLGDAYKAVEGTDAQEVTTVQEHLDVAYAMGLVPTKEYDEMSEIIRKADGGYYEFKSVEHMKVIMQPMKPVYSGTRKSVQNGALLEDYVKSSSFPLYPPLTAGTEMEHLRVLMEKGNIQRANYVSAKKLGIPAKPVEMFDKQGRFTNPSQDTINGAMQQLSRDGFRIQQEVPYDEEKEAIKIVSQMNKLITEGIALIPELAGLREKKEQIRSQMILNNLKDYFEKFNIKERDGQLVMPGKDKVYDILVEEARKKGYSLNELQGLLSRDDKGELSIPLMFNTAADRFESLLMSMVKKVAEVKMPGKSYVQAASVGLRFTKEGSIDKSKVVWLEDYDGSELKTLRKDTDGIIRAAQVLAPFNFFDNDGNKLNVEDFMTMVDGRRVLDTSRVPKELIQLVGARIPNQGHNSMLPIEIVGFILDNMGDLIVVPSAITKQMGADFDVDKLYTYKRPYYMTEDGVLDTYPSDNEKEGLQTQYFNIHWTVLTHPDMIEKVLNPLDKPDLGNENKLLAPAEGIVDYYDVNNQLRDFQSGKDAKTLVGSTSLSVTFNSVIQDKDLYLYHKGEEGETVRDYITVIDEDGNELKLTNLSGYGTSIYNGEVRTKHDNLTTMQSAAVDNAKERTLDNLNLTTNTYKAAAAFVQLETEDGKAVNLKYVTRLLTQPIIREYDALMKSGNDSLSEEFQKDLKGSVIKQLEDKYKNEDDAEVIFDADSLLKAGKTNTSQLAALRLFVQLDTIGQRLTELQSLANGDTNGAGPNLLSSIDKEKKMSTVDQAPIANASQIFDGTEQGTIFDSTTVIANRTLTKLLPYEKLVPVFDQIRTLSGKDRLNIDQQRSIIRSIRSFVYTSGNQWWSNAQGDRVRLLYNSSESKSLAQRLIDAKRTWGKDNYFLQRLNPVIGSTLSSPDYVEYQAATVGTIDEEQNHRNWVGLLIPTDETLKLHWIEMRQLGEDLMRYAFLTGGVQDANSFVKFVPVSYIANTAFGDMLKARETSLREHGADPNEQDTTFEAFAKQYIQHNPELATQVSQDALGKLDPGQDYPESFRVNTEGEVPSVLKSVTGTFLPFISYRSKAEGNTYKLYQRQDIGDSIYYTRIDTLGNQYTDEYDGKVDTSLRSIFTENRSLAEQIPGINLVNNSIRTNGKGSDITELNIKPGGVEAIKDVLGTIRSSTDLPEYLRTVARVLETIQPGLEQFDAREVLGQGTKNLSLRIDTNLGERGSYDASGTITINPNNSSNKTEISEILLHELQHDRLQGIIASAGFDSRIFDRLNTLPENEKQVTLDKMKNFGNKYPEMIKSLEALDTIRYEAYNFFRNQFGEERFQRALKGEGSQRDQLLVYAFGTLQEFVAHVMTDSQVAEYLNGIQSTRGETLLDRIWNLFSELLESFAKLLGMKVKEGSLLKEALAHTLKLTTLNVSSDVNITNALNLGTTLEVPSEAQALELQSLGENTYNRKTSIATDLVNYKVDFGKVKVSNSTQVGKIIEKLTKQLEDAGYALDKGTKEQRVAAQIRFRELSDDINTLKREQNIDLIAEIGKKQLAWVDKILNTPHPLAVDVLNAKNITDTWSNLIELLYDGTTTSTNSEFGEIAQQAIQRRMTLMQIKAQEVVSDALGNRLTLTGMDYKDKIEDIGFATANFLTLARVKPKLVQGIAILGRQAANNRDEEIGRVRDKLMDLEARMKKTGIRPEHFIQDDHWGLVSRLSGKWYNHLTNLRSKLDTSIENAEKNEKDEKVRGTKKSDAYNKYWNEIKKSAVFVDLREFYDTTANTLVPKTDTAKAFKKLADAVGSEEYARELLEKAEAKYQEYIDERTVAKDVIQARTDLTDTEKNDEYQKWKNHNSPIDFLNKMTQKGDVKYVNSGSKWITMVPKKESTEFYDTKYKDIHEKGGETQKIYEDYKALMEQMKEYLPLTEQQKLQEDFLPIISRETVLSLSGMIGSIRNWDNAVMNSLTAIEQEEMWRLKGDHLPVLYTRSTKKTEDEANRSTDLIRMLELFSMMALHHKHLGQVVDAINVAQDILKDVNRQKVDNDEKGIKNTLDSVKYFVDKLIYKKPAELEGRLDVPVYSANPVQQYKITSEVTKLTIERNKLEEQKSAEEDEGKYQNEELDEKIKAIDDRLAEIAGDARFLYASKGIDTMIRINQLKALSYNPFSAVSNFTFGLISVSIHANARRDYDGKAMRWAMGMMMNATKKYYSFGTMNNTDAIKIQALMDRVGMMGDIVDTQYGKSNLHTRRDKPVVDAIKPYNWQKSGDYFAKGAMMLAMLKFKEIELSDGAKISLWEALNEKGQWNAEKYGERPEWYSEDDVTGQTEWNSFRDKIRKVGILVFGNQDKNAPLMGKKHSLIRLMGQFRMSWFAEGVASRFAAERFDVELGRAVKGRYRTPGDIGYGTSGIILCKQLLSVLPGIKVDAFKGMTYSKGENAGKPLTELDIENMRKNFAGLAWTMAMTAAILMIKGIAFDDDRKKGKKRTAQDAQWQLLLNMVIRNHQDLMLYASPSVFDTVTGNIMPATTVLTDTWKALKASGTYLANPDEKDAFEKWAKKQARAVPFANLWPKIDYMTRRSLDAISR